MTLLKQQSLVNLIHRHRGPIVVWLVACTAVWLMLRERSVVVEARGLVQAASVVVSPLETGQLTRIEVGLLQDVRRGQVLARLDDTRLHAEAAVVLAEVEALRQESLLEDSDRRLDEAGELRRFTADVEQARLRILEILAILQPDRITLADLERDVASYADLLAGEMVSVRECERVRAEYDAMAEKVADYESLLIQARGDLEQAEQRRQSFLAQQPALTADAAVVDVAAQSLAARLEVLQRQLEEVAVRREDLVLTAPFDGVVIQIPASPGQVVRPGDPVLTLTAARAEQIVVWLDERSVERLRRREDLLATVIQARDGQQRRAECPVVRIGPTVIPLPEELWPSPTRPMRGRPVVLGIPAGLDLVPGELVTVRWG
jgi:multidrug resistance efflux pump